ncbi:MAG: J domain-containing protein, partial [Proteobacteria bacterium]|nr:J domain-containing protein [Pseudomonadota bacterium]
YELLDVPPSASFEDIERAHRQKYRWARNLRDKQRASSIYTQLDQAWRVLKDPAHRRRYDADYARRKSAPDGGWSKDDAERNRPPPRDTSTEPTIRMKPLDAAALANGLGFGDADASTQEVKAPKPPESIAKRTLGLSQGTTSTKRRPRLAVASPELVQVKARRGPVERRIVVKNTGRGRMPGRVASDRDWLEVDRSRLDPDALEQEITVTIQPSRMPRSKSVALVTVVTDHGERRAITFRVERQPIAVPLLVVGGLIVVGVAIAQFGGFLSFSEGDPEASADQPSVLEVSVDPAADNIRIDGYTQAAGSFARMESGFPLDEPFTLSVQKEHFQPYEAELRVAAGTTQRVDVVLELDEIPVWDPDDDAEAAVMDDRRAKASIAERGEKLQGCFADAEVATASLDVEVTIGNM